MSTLNLNRRSQRGKVRLGADLRTNCISVRLNDAELSLLDSKRGQYRQGEWLRMAALDVLPKHTPEANSALSFSLSKLLGAFGSLMQTNNLDAEKLQMMAEMRAEIVALRLELEGEKVKK